MLEILHNKIQSIINIHGISDLHNNNFSIDYIDNPNEQQLNEINQILLDWPLEKLKLEKLYQIDLRWQSNIDNGWITPYGWKLGINTQDVALLTGAFILAKEASNMGISNTGTVIDMDGKSHELSLENMTLLMLQYGQFRAQLSEQDASLRQLINSATTIEELDNIII